MDVPSKTPQIKSSKRWVLLLAITVGIATISTAVYTISRYRRLLSTSAPTSSPSIPIAKAVTAIGRLEPKGEAVHAATTGSLEGTRILQILVKEGDKVRAGQILAILDTRDRAILVLGIDPTKTTLHIPEINQNLNRLKLDDVAILGCHCQP